MKYQIHKIMDYQDAEVSLLEPLRQKKIAYCKRIEGQAELKASGMLLREMLKEAGYPVEGPLNIAYQCCGKPYLEDLSWYFSLSHSGEYVMCALDHQEIGADIERIRSLPDSLMRRILNEEEYAAYDSLSDEEKPKAAIRYWTIKESIVKCIGTGIRCDLRTLPMEEYDVTCGEMGEYLFAIAEKKVR